MSAWEWMRFGQLAVRGVAKRSNEAESSRKERDGGEDTHPIGIVVCGKGAISGTNGLACSQLSLAWSIQFCA